MNVFSQIGRYVEAFERGLMTEAEFGSSFAFDVASSIQNREVVLAIFKELPPQLQKGVLDWLQELRQMNFVWKPLQFGKIFSNEEQASFQAQLKLLYNLLVSL